jgi:hypothetical protein
MKNLLFEENFDKKLIDENKWNVCEYNRCANNEQQAYMKENVKIVDNKLILLSIQ